jgi:hypothetical protein
MEEIKNDHRDAELLEFVKHIKKDSDMQGLSLPAQEELKNRIDRKNKRHDQRFVRLLVWSGSVAASICLILAAGWYMFSPARTIDYLSVMQSFKSDNLTSDDVQLLLSDNQKITIEGKETQVDYSNEGCVNINKNEKVDVKKEDARDEKTIFNQLIVPTGKRSMLTLSDGTRVWINSGSKLVFPANFEKNKREVFVEGEIYLDVTPDVERPFIVHTKAIDLKVLGTQFNVSAYTDQPDLQVVLVTGKVEIRENGNSKGILNPNQMFSLNEESHSSFISAVDVMDHIAWKDGYYIFHSKDLSTVFAKLSKYYNVQFKWDNKIIELVCSGKLDLKMDIQEVLNSLEKAAPTIKIKNISEREYTIIVKP